MLGLMALVMGEPLRAHACPMHDGAAVMSLAAHGGADAGAADMHAAHGGSHDTTTGDSSHHTDGERHACQCVGACCPVVPVAAPAHVPTTVGVVVATTAVVAPMVPVAIPGTSDVVLPFAIGPPPTA